jgi:hypothetical protein
MEMKDTWHEDWHKENPGVFCRFCDEGSGPKLEDTTEDTCSAISVIGEDTTWVVRGAYKFARRIQGEK